MSKIVTVDGVQLELLGDAKSGGQGEVQICRPIRDPSIKLAYKRMEPRGQLAERTETLCAQSLGQHSPLLAAPFLCGSEPDGSLVHIAPYAEGVDWEEDVDRELPQALEVGLQFVSLIEILDEHGISHGDLDINNIRIQPDGTVSLIDFDGFISADPRVPKPTTTGHRRMQAPELRGKEGVLPTQESDRYSLAVLLSMTMFGRFPTDGLPDTPIEIDRLMTQGHWPEHDRFPEPDELKIETLGAELIALFDRGFSLNPKARPSAKDWRLGLSKALHNCWQHECGTYFVATAETALCPGCGSAINAPSSYSQLKVTLMQSGRQYTAPIKDKSPIVLGRKSIPELPRDISGEHLKITPHGERLHLHHLGQNNSLIEVDGNWYSVSRDWVSLKEFRDAAINLRLSNTLVQLQFE